MIRNWVVQLRIGGPGLVFFGIGFLIYWIGLERIGLDYRLLDWIGMDWIRPQGAYFKHFRPEAENHAKIGPGGLF